MNTSQKIHPCLWFDGNAEDAANFYVKIFPHSRIGHKMMTTEEVSEASGVPTGTVLTVEFYLNDQPFLALNGGPHFKFNEAISMVINCNDQAELDSYWNKLGAGGPVEAQQCGWLKDKFGLSWQVVPTRMVEMIKDKDQQKAARVMAAIMHMKKLDIAEMERAFNGKEETVKG
jgi:predicted 3-demethylubiquinone-9 3-methyltransferase (glyoxalase superfamily)